MKDNKERELWERELKEKETREKELVQELLDSRQYTRLRQHFSEQNEADVAAVLEEMEEEEMLRVFRILFFCQTPRIFVVKIFPTRC